MGWWWSLHCRSLWSVFLLFLNLSDGAKIRLSATGRCQHLSGNWLCGNISEIILTIILCFFQLLIIILCASQSVLDSLPRKFTIKFGKTITITKSTRLPTFPSTQSPTTYIYQTWYWNSVLAGKHYLTKFLNANIPCPPG